MEGQEAIKMKGMGYGIGRSFKNKNGRGGVIWLRNPFVVVKKLK